ncbi:hypothetical protein [Arthrobacter sp. Leaf234]|uniref:hypothetical protein n=1 Tax=Arthrobacter sp. Leaf234 TaxID=1736303 RepID=UPI0012FAAC94|nr:hypothetical protein [Arthrobacter sp. Leaf234]
MKNTSLLTLAMTAALGLAGCAAPATEAGPGTTATATTSSATATTSSATSSTPSAASSAPSAASSASPGPSVSSSPTLPADGGTGAASATAAPEVGPSLADPSSSLFTTSDGLYSFMLPAGWTTTPLEPSTAPDYGVPLGRTAYNILDGEGREMAVFAGGVPGDGAALPSPGHVPLDDEELPALSAQVDKVELPVSYVFDHYQDPVTGERVYLARYHLGPVPEDGLYGVPLGLLPLGENGLVVFTATFGTDRFPTPADAEAWLGTQEYAGLRGMFTSLTYNG